MFKTMIVGMGLIILSACGKLEEISRKEGDVLFEGQNLIINEIMPNPAPDGFPFIELYNRGQHAVNLQDYSLARAFHADSLSRTIPLSATARQLDPGAFLVVTVSYDSLKKKHPDLSAATTLEVSRLPQMNNGGGGLALLKGAAVSDLIFYEEAMHHPLLRNPKGVSLERITYQDLREGETNFYSAAASSNFATPGLENSQFSDGLAESPGFWLDSPTVSPDGDGFEDELICYFELPKAGYLCNVTLVDQRVLPVKQLHRNYSLATRGRLTWDGFLAEAQPAAAGLYYLIVELYHPDGERLNYKKTCFVATPF